MTEPTMTDAERQTVEAMAAASYDHDGPHTDTWHRAGRNVTDAYRSSIEAALRSLKPGARLPGGLVVVWANQAELLGYNPAAAALAERNKRDYEAAARSTERLSPEQEAAAHGPPSPGNGG